MTCHAVQVCVTGCKQYPKRGYDFVSCFICLFSLPCCLRFVVPSSFSDLFFVFLLLFLRGGGIGLNASDGLFTSFHSVVDQQGVYIDIVMSSPRIRENRNDN